jgi:hypothetical protein
MTRVLPRPELERLTPRRRDRKLPAVTSTPPPSLGDLLSDQTPGTWVVIDPTMTRIICAAASPEEAMERAGIKPEASTDDDGTGNHPVMIQVMDPAGLRFY